MGNKLGKLTARLTLITEEDSSETTTNITSEKGKQSSVIGKNEKDDGKTKHRQKQPYVRGEIKEVTRDNNNNNNNNNHPSSSSVRPPNSTTSVSGGIGNNRPLMTSAAHPTGSKKQSVTSIVTPIRAPLSSVPGANVDMSAFDTSLDLRLDPVEDSNRYQEEDQDPIHVAMNYVPTEVPRPESIIRTVAPSSSSAASAAAVSSPPAYVGVAVFNVSGIDLNAMVRSGQIHNEVGYHYKRDISIRQISFVIIFSLFIGCL